MSDGSAPGNEGTNDNPGSNGNTGNNSASNEAKVDGVSEAKQAKLEDSNMANYGSKEHRELRHNAAKKEPAWTSMDTGVGIQVWRIEKFKVKVWPKKQYGSFYDGDSYIILNTKKDPESDKLLYDIYFWLGKDTTQDEAGTAAYKTVELDDYFNDEPVQYREVQGNESKQFIELFGKIKILNGGIESGFNHVEQESFNNKLLHITGYKKNIHVFQVPIAVNSLNNNDCFILDTGEIIFQFNGDKANKNEKLRAAQVVSEIKNDRGKCDSIIIDGLSDTSEDAMKFWGILGISNDKPILNDRNDGNNDDIKMELTLQRISNASGHMSCVEEQRGKKLDKNKLDSKDCFIVDAGVSVFLWLGNKSNASEKKQIWKYCNEYLKNQGRLNSVTVSMVKEGRETPQFWKAFNGDGAPGGYKNRSLWDKIFN